jgi:hypothetical protein
MNTLKMSLLFAMSMVATQLFSESNDLQARLKAYTLHVGDTITIPVGSIGSDQIRPSCMYGVGNMDEIYFYNNPSGATNILAPDEWFDRYEGQYDVYVACHRVKAIKPGKVTIAFSRIPFLDNCGCKYVHDDQKAYVDCKKACDVQEKEETIDNYSLVTITVLPTVAE